MADVNTDKIDAFIAKLNEYKKKADDFYKMAKKYHKLWGEIDFLGLSDWNFPVLALLPSLCLMAVGS
jgi:hypothetical protein